MGGSEASARAPRPPAPSTDPLSRLPLGARWAIAWGARGLLIFAGLAPFIPPLTAGVPALHWLGDVLSLWYGFQCARDPTRSLAWLGLEAAVCTRCLGIYFGLGLGGVIAAPRLKELPLRLWVAVAAVAMVADVLTEALALRPESPPIRLLTGLLLAYPVAVAVVQVTRYRRKPTAD